MPLTISGAPATFERLVEKAGKFGKSLEEHEERLKVLERLREVGLKISLNKCQFCQTKVKYVGHIVSAEGVEVDLAKVEAVHT